MSLEPIIQQQQETLQRWHQQSSRDAEDLAESLIEAKCFTGSVTCNRVNWLSKKSYRKVG